MDNYIYFLAMFQIFWTLAMVVSMIKSKVFHGDVPVKDTSSTLSGGRLKRKTDWRFVGDDGNIRLLESDCKTMPNYEAFCIIFMWVFVPIAGLYRLVTGKTMDAKLLVISSVLMWSLPFIYSFVSTINIVITFN